MLKKHLIKDSEKRKRVAHFIAVVTILTHSFNNFEQGHSSYKIFAVLGFVFLLLAILHPLIVKRIYWIDWVFLSFEGVLSLVIAIELFQYGKKALPLSYLILGIFQFFIAFRKGKREIHKIPRSPEIASKI